MITAAEAAMIENDKRIRAVAEATAIVAALEFHIPMSARSEARRALAALLLAQGIEFTTAKMRGEAEAK